MENKNRSVVSVIFCFHRLVLNQRHRGLLPDATGACNRDRERERGTGREISSIERFCLSELMPESNDSAYAIKQSCAHYMRLDGCT